MKESRLQQLQDIIKKNGSLQISEAAEMFNVSTMTIRRDLEHLAEKGLIIRTHGGAMPVQTLPTDTPFKARSFVALQQKHAIAHEAAKTVSPGQRVFLSSGTTISNFAVELENIPNLTIVTDAINIAFHLFTFPDKTIVMIGGEVNAATMATIGPDAETAIDAYCFDALYLGVTAIDQNGNLYLGSIAEHGLFKKILNKKSRIFILADSSKLGKTDFIRVGRLGNGYTLITDSGATPQIIEAYRALDCAVILSD